MTRPSRIATPSDDPNRLMTVAEVAGLTATTPGWWYKAAALDLLPIPPVRIGRHLRFRYRDVIAWIDSQTKG